MRGTGPGADPKAFMSAKHGAWIFGTVLFGVLTQAGACGPVGDPIPSPVERCDDDEPPPASGFGLQIGSGEGEAFRPLADDAEVQMFVGPQGGQHVFIGLRYYTATSTVWIHELEIVDEGSGAPVGNGNYYKAGCVGWNQIELIPVFVFDKATPGGKLSVELRPDSYPPPELPAVQAEVRLRFLAPAE